MTHKSKFGIILAVLGSIGLLLALVVPPEAVIAASRGPVGTSNPVGTFSRGLSPIAKKPVKLSQLSTGGSLPSIVKTPAGQVLVAWQQNVPVGNKVQQEIFARTSADGVNFDPFANLSNTTTNSREPFLLNADGGSVFAFFQDYPGNSSGWQIMNSTWISPTWSVPVRLTQQPGWTFQDPTAVEASDGTFWFADQVYFGGGTATDAIIQRMSDGVYFNLSNDGSAVRRPALAAGVNGQIYIGWLDHCNEGRCNTPGFKIRQWNGTAWVKLPDASNDGYTSFPALAFQNGLLYAAWPANIGTLGIKMRIWNGTVWNKTAIANPMNGARNLKLVVTADGNIFLSWDKNGVVYMQRNTNPKVVVSTGVPNAQQASLFVDSNDVAYLAFQNGAIWYTTVP